MPDNGLASLAGSLLEAGHDVRIADYGAVATVRRLFPEALSRRVQPLAEKLFIEHRRLSWLEKLRFLRAGAQLERHQEKEIRAIAAEAADEAVRFGADYVGLKLWNGDGFSGSVRIADAVRLRAPRVRIIGGGPHADYFGGHILQYTDAFDQLIQGEGEQVLPALIAALERKGDWRQIPGVVWKHANRISCNPTCVVESLDQLPLPVYDHQVYPALDGDGKLKIGVLDESRGCPNRCAFCIHPIKSGGRWHMKSPARVAAEVRRLMDQLGSRCFIYSGSNTSARVAIDIARELLKERLDVRYGCFGHVRSIGKADFDLLRRSGCEAIFYGLESGSERILREAFDKPLDLAEAEHVIRQTKEAGICAIASVIYPAPFEDAESRRATLEFLRRVRPDSVPVTIPGMIPGTPWEKEPEKYGFKKSDRADLWEYGLTYKIKLLFPPSQWKPLPYTLNGKSSKQLFAECEAFIRDIEAEGLVTDLSHESVLMADALGERNDLAGFRDRCRAMFLSGDVESISALVKAINRNVTPAAGPEKAAGAGTKP
jgi:anaerobic magnesium-protoporphyrin IX monomethyl ester cyclase